MMFSLVIEAKTPEQNSLVTSMQHCQGIALMPLLMAEEKDKGKEKASLLPSSIPSLNL